MVLRAGYWVSGAAALVPVQTLELFKTESGSTTISRHVAYLRTTRSPQVSASDTHGRTKKQVILHSVRYDITVSIASAGIYQMELLRSSEEGAWSPLSGDPIQAVALTNVGLEVHHSLLRRRGPMVQRRSCAADGN
jgi:hypothetical protein